MLGRSRQDKGGPEAEKIIVSLTRGWSFGTPVVQQVGVLRDARRFQLFPWRGKLKRWPTLPPLFEYRTPIQNFVESKLRQPRARETMTFAL
jgi:hypothetical protein